MQITIYICIPNIQGFLNKQDFYGIVECTPVSMATKSDFQFELKAFWPSTTHHCVNRKKSGAKISA